MDPIAAFDQAQPVPSGREAPAPHFLQTMAGTLWAVGGVLAATALFWLARRDIDNSQASLLYLPIVIACAVRYGFGPAVLAALLSFVCWDYFFLPPLHALNVANSHDLISLMVFLVAAVTTGRLAAHARSQAHDAQTRLRETAVLYQASDVISREIEPERMLNALVAHVVGACQASHCLILRPNARTGEMMIAHAAGDRCLTPEQECQIRLTAASADAQTAVLRHGATIGSMTAPLRMESYLGTMYVGVRTDGSPFTMRDERLILTLANHAAIVMARQIQEDRAKLQAGQAAVLQERNRLANDIHDTLSHAFTGIKFLLEAALRVGPTPQAVECVTQARNLAIEGAQEARRSVWALRPTALDEADGLIAAVRALVLQQTAGTPLAADVVIEGQARALPEAMEEHLLRICQEALTNILRHADASRVEIRLIFAEDHIRCRIQDDGVGFAAHAIAPAGFGLVSMRERSERIGGRFDVVSRPGHGTNVIIEVPLLSRPFSSPQEPIHDPYGA